MEQQHPNSQLVQTLIDNQNAKLADKQQLEIARNKFATIISFAQNFFLSILLIVCVGSVVTMAKGCTGNYQNVGGR